MIVQIEFGTSTEKLLTCTYSIIPNLNKCLSKSSDAERVLVRDDLVVGQVDVEYPLADASNFLTVM